VVNRPERRGESRSTGRPCCWGETPDGRYVICVYEYLDESCVSRIYENEAEGGRILELNGAIKRDRSRPVPFNCLMSNHVSQTAAFPNVSR